MDKISIARKEMVVLSDAVELLQTLPNNSVDLVLTDPPFGVGYQNCYTNDRHDIISGDEAEFSYAEFACEAYRVLKPDSALFAFTRWSVYPSHFIQVQNAGFKMREPLICQKRAAGVGSYAGTFQSNADWLLFAHKGQFHFQSTNLIRSKRAGTIPNIGRAPVPEFKRRLPACWFGEEFPRSSENSSYQRVRGLKHPTIKGLVFCEWLVQLASPKGGLVVDPFVGSGTVAEAARNQDRVFIVGDSSAECIEVTQKRLNMSL